MLVLVIHLISFISAPRFCYCANVVYLIKLLFRLLLFVPLACSSFPLHFCTSLPSCACKYAHLFNTLGCCHSSAHYIHLFATLLFSVFFFHLPRSVANTKLNSKYCLHVHFYFVHFSLFMIQLCCSECFFIHCNATMILSRIFLCLPKMFAFFSSHIQKKSKHFETKTTA